jgi:hypothetical protein
MKTRFAVITVLALVAFNIMPAFAQTTYNSTSVQSPGDPAFTQLLGINDSAIIAGHFGDGTSVLFSGFTLNLPNNYTPENVLTAAQTRAFGINALNETDGLLLFGTGLLGLAFLTKKRRSVATERRAAVQALEISNSFSSISKGPPPPAAYYHADGRR